MTWLEEAINSKVSEPHAMTLSTVDSDGYPDARVLILKNIDERGWYFASSSESRKGNQLKANPKSALTFYWKEVGRQIRIRGKVMEAEPNESAKDFLHRGVTAKAIALIGKQSSVMDDPESFNRLLDEKFRLLEREPETIYPGWTLYRVEAFEVEFWQGNEERKHIRVRYKFEQGNWKIDSLYP